MSQYVPKPYELFGVVSIRVDVSNYASHVDVRSFTLKSNLASLKSKMDTLDTARLTDFNAKITEVDGKIPSISGLATNSALTAVENSLVKKTNYNTKISEIEKKTTDHNHDKYITTPEFNTMAASVFNARLTQANLMTKIDLDAELKKISDRVASNRTSHLLIENKLKKN